MWLPSCQFLFLVTLHDLYCICILNEQCILFYDNYRFNKISLCLRYALISLIVLSIHPPARPSCLTHFLWYSGPVPTIAFEEEPEEAVGEPQRLVEWQADNVI